MNWQRPVPLSRRVVLASVSVALCANVLLAAACGGDPTDPTPQLQISCPASKSVESLTGDPVSVDYGASTATGGKAPVSTSCSALSGSNFPVGTTNVVCTARDAKQQTATCSLSVVVTRVGTLNATRFMAFGDSLTFGPLLTPCNTVSGLSLGERLQLDALFLRRLTVRDTPPTTSYPSVLQGLLKNRYVTQSLSLFNEGLGGEFVTDGGGGTNDGTLTRLRQRLVADSPQAVLLLEGINDINVYFLHKVDRVPQVVKALRDLVREIRQRNAQVLIGTLLPEDANGCRGSQGFDLVAPADDQIRTMAASENATVVDLYQAFGGVPGPYLNDDGLHPNPAGYEKMAQTFFDSIKKNLEIPR